MPINNRKMAIFEVKWVMAVASNTEVPFAAHPPDVEDI
jgi:hypothetical protein